jgi:hypothetical protein
MSNVHQLPDTMQRQWRVFDGMLKDGLATGGCTAAEINYACAQLKPIYLHYSQPKDFSGDPEKVLVEFNTWVRTQIFGLLQIVAVRDIELFRLRGGK